MAPLKALFSLSSHGTPLPSLSLSPSCTLLILHFCMWLPFEGGLLASTCLSGAGALSLDLLFSHTAHSH